MEMLLPGLLALARRGWTITDLHGECAAVVQKGRSTGSGEETLRTVSDGNEEKAAGNSTLRKSVLCSSDELYAALESALSNGKRIDVTTNVVSGSRNNDDVEEEAVGDIKEVGDIWQVLRRSALRNGPLRTEVPVNGLERWSPSKMRKRRRRKRQSSASLDDTKLPSDLRFKSMRSISQSVVSFSSGMLLQEEHRLSAGIEDLDALGQLMEAYLLRGGEFVRKLQELCLRYEAAIASKMATILESMILSASVPANRLTPFISMGVVALLASIDFGIPIYSQVFVAILGCIFIFRLCDEYRSCKERLQGELDKLLVVCKDIDRAMLDLSQEDEERLGKDGSNPILGAKAISATPLERVRICTMKSTLKAASSSYAFLDDDTYLRFLRARNQDVTSASTQLRNMFLWHSSNSVGDLTKPLPDSIRDGFYPGGVSGWDRDGDPILWGKLGECDPQTLILSLTLRELCLEEARRFETIRQDCYKRSRPARYTAVFDLTGLGTKHVWTIGIRAFKIVAAVPYFFYPEMLKQALIINAPMVFPIIWNIVKHVFDERTRKKIKIVSGNPTELLIEHIPTKHVPAALGGTAKGGSDGTGNPEGIYRGGIVPEKYHRHSLATFKSFLAQANAAVGADLGERVGS